MKHVITCAFFALFCTSVSAQRTLVLDSTAIVNDKGSFFEYRNMQWNNGESAETVTLIGDTAAVTGRFLNTIDVTGNQMAACVAVAATQINALATILTASDALLAATGTSGISAAYNNYKYEFVGLWNLHDNRETKEANIQIGDFDLEMELPGPQVLHVEIWGAGLIHIKNYPGAVEDIYLWKFSANKYGDASNTIYLERQ